ncbi:hypothetical protein EDD22DRAFT_851106 [Suillus occidentalis]|nr:hypothetical protein EDD22DRAFT_851106 [Suillus occidentalis]
MSSHSMRLSMTEASCPSHLQIVKRGHHDLSPKTGLLSLPEELQFNVLHLLSGRDILRCTSMCFYNDDSLAELQYIVELSGQRLLPVPNTNNHTPISERLQLLRDKAHAWFKFNPHSFQTVSVPNNNRLYYADKTITRTPHIDLRALDGGIHPQAAGSRLLLSEPLRYKANESANLKGLGSHIALRRVVPRFDQ